MLLLYLQQETAQTKKTIIIPCSYANIEVSQQKFLRDETVAIYPACVLLSGIKDQYLMVTEKQSEYKCITYPTHQIISKSFWVAAQKINPIPRPAEAKV